MSSVFKNRWMALLWAGGILWFAYDFAAAAPEDNRQENATTDASGVPVSSDDQNRVAAALGN
jgi:hypothetical protein